MMNSTQTDPSSKLKAQASLQSITQNHQHQHQHQHQIWPPAFYVHQQPIPELLSAEEDDEEEHRRSSREHMFEKPLTPSDVGKLNRLVIPKQHAEKYFPLSGTDSAEKGFLLSFEDESGKPWRFRYSYWTSSQSYVLTKGWSRFVKEKRLDAGDVVTFQRLRFDNDKFFISCRRRSAPAHVSPAAHYPYSPFTPPPPSQLALSYHPDRCYMRDAAEPVDDGAAAPISIATPGNSKRLRLFGVNLDCQMDGPGPQGPECSGLSGHGLLASSWSSPL